MADLPVSPESPRRGIAPPAIAGTLGRLGDLEVRLAQSHAELVRAQELRYQVFYEEMSAIADIRTRIMRRDADEFDRFCDHLLVLDHGARSKIVGTYRLLRQEVALAGRGFYTAHEFDIEPMLRHHADRNFLELGRSCVLKPYRTKRTVELLWHGIWTFVRQHGLDVMFGCASLEGTDMERLGPLLGFLRGAAPSPTEWRVAAQPGRGIPLDDLPGPRLSPEAAWRALPPLIKGYLRIGGTVGEAAVIDRQFGTTDIFVVLPVERMNPRYINHYGIDATRYAA